MKLSEIAKRAVELANAHLEEYRASVAHEPLFVRASDLKPEPPSRARQELRKFLLAQPVAVIQLLMLIMYAGRGDIDAAEIMEEYHVNHWRFGKPTADVDHMLAKWPLLWYWQDGLERLAKNGIDLDKLLEG
jgi:hypothetical protein